jgi:hypothetical protein
MAVRSSVDHRLQLKVVRVSFSDGREAEARAEGNNAAWHCVCGALLVGRCYFQFGDTCYTECDCGRRYRVAGDAKKRAESVAEVAA